MQFMPLTPVHKGDAAAVAQSLWEDTARFNTFFDCEPRVDAIPITVVCQRTFPDWMARQSSAVQQWVQFHQFESLLQDADSRGRSRLPSKPRDPVLLLPPEAVGSAHRPAAVLVAASDADTKSAQGVAWTLAALPACLPPAAYVLQQLPSELSPTAAALAWALGTYAFDRYKTRRHIDTAAPAYPTLARPHGCTWAYVESAARAAFLARDLINTPSEHMGPATLEACARVLAEALQGTCRAIVGDALLRDNFPQVHAVGRAAAERHAPRLIELEFAPDTDAATGDQDALSIVLVGKGVTFDSGGLDLKPSSAMRLMKKDMGGAANVLGLALMLRSDAALRRRLHLRVLVPAVENAVSGGAFRPGDVLTARNGMTTEVGNTDAEGRLILADALVYATESAPRLVVDCATLTGAGRVALGTDVPAMFSNDDQVAVELLQAAERTGDALWRLPLHTPYRKLLRSTVADVQNVSDGPYAGCITAALYLNEFVQPTGAGNAAARPAPAWIHIDHMAYATSSAPGRPEGGLEQGIRALHAMISKRYGGGGKE
ncbi:hypothetical protein CDCA_CDCA18G4583 [Cyanidium caldarium]|uniref:Cytosol aminopeptidase domain-containing protein n=1 Tax=Cyanidium caldarium TaxID=2771 RepID=A0AAV9J1S7_CYACA|nr:hypothetical protein CDCA_CDCA18G4583 [Cyanidium caldarium]